MKKLVFVFVLFFSFPSISMSKTFICYNGNIKVRVNSSELTNPFFLSERKRRSDDTGVIYGTKRVLFDYKGVNILQETNYIEKEKVQIWLFKFKYPNLEKKVRYYIANNERPFTCKKQK